MKHSTLGPSGAHRWAVCAASVKASEGLPRKSSPWAKEGTMGHEVVALCVLNGVHHNRLDGFIRPAASDVGEPFEVQQDGEPVETMAFTQELADLVQPGLDWLATRRIEFIEVEQWGDLTKLLGPDPITGERQGGSLDLGFIEIETWFIVITIWDWKLGQEPVEVADNWQLSLYAWSFLDRNRDRIRELMRQYPDRKVIVRLAIEQPCVSGGGGFWYTTPEDLDSFGGWIKEKAALAQDAYLDLRPDDFNPGLKQCRWCAARENNKCEAYDKFMLKTMVDKLPALIEDVSHRAPPPELPTFLTPERRGWLLRHKSAIISWLERLHAQALDDGLMGLPTPGQKVISGRRAARKWRNEARARRALALAEMMGMLKSMYAPPELLTPPALETLVGKKLYEQEFQSLVTQGDGKPVLVDEDDEGEPLKPLVQRLPPITDDDIPF